MSTEQRGGLFLVAMSSKCEPFSATEEPKTKLITPTMCPHARCLNDGMICLNDGIVDMLCLVLTNFYLLKTIDFI